MILIMKYIYEIRFQLLNVCVKCNYNYEICMKCDCWIGRSGIIFSAKPWFKLKKVRIFSDMKRPLGN